ncbi:MAG: hypothetical protein VX335_05440 [Pseudomonadota bacterium]|nr:hypothetical protein [Pseudomonadota bacterium]
MLKTMGNFKKLPENNHYSMLTKNTNYKIYRAILIPLLIILSWVGLVYSSYLSNQMFSLLTYGNLINLGLVGNLPMCQAFVVVFLSTCLISALVGCIKLLFSNGTGPSSPTPGGGSGGIAPILSNSLTYPKTNSSVGLSIPSNEDGWYNYDNTLDFDRGIKYTS